MKTNDTHVSRWCPNCQNWFDIDEDCSCASHVPSSRSKKREKDKDDIPPKKRKKRIQ